MNKKITKEDKRKSLFDNKKYGSVCEQYIKNNGIFQTFKDSTIFLIIAVITLLVGLHFDNWIQYIGGLLCFAVVTDAARQQGYYKGFVHGYGKGVEDAYDEYSDEQNKDQP